MSFALVQKYAQYSVKRPWCHRIGVAVILFVFLFSSYGLLAHEELSYLLGIFITFAATGLFASASAFKKRYPIQKS
ncbi:hypothetical protein [Vibrio sp. STUT-A11]|uniref:hypothetical protein n=1 Tax=Vibrio sp. STUT-A11 TaxID=2976236 RepID=UPI0022317427|nr:hypothetical protein [Vibrio sp. STUT-A11]BDR16134.1 hypothetical protein VspSTUT11_41100 [Vibrio sp. STUT-A11]